MNCQFCGEENHGYERGYLLCGKCRYAIYDNCPSPRRAAPTQAASRSPRPDPIPPRRENIRMNKIDLAGCVVIAFVVVTVLAFVYAAFVA